MQTENLCRCCLSEGVLKDLNSPYKWFDKEEIYSNMLNDCFRIILHSSKSAKICITCIQDLRVSFRFKEQVLKAEEEFLKRINGEQAKMGAYWSERKNIFNVNIRGLDIKQKQTPKKTSERKINIIWASPAGNDKTKHKENVKTILNFSNAVPFKNRSLLGYICGYCDSTHPDPANLRSHVETDHKKDRLQLKLSIDHREYTVKLDVTDLSCKLCNEGMDNLNELKEHLVKAHGKTIHSDIKDFILQFKLKKGDVYDCALCSSTYETFKMLKQHMNIHYSNYSCSKCDATFAVKRSLSAHLATHQEGSFKCDYCEKVFATKTKKHYHVKTNHSGARNVGNCPYCDVSFRNYYQRNQHLVKVHNSEARYKCNICNKAYLLKTLLMYHIKKNHLMEKNCQCTECGYRFFSKKALKAHMVKHTGERKFSCEICLKSYARKYTLREHMRIHNNDRRFKCDVCELTFVQKCSLKSHLLSNHGISMAASDIASV
ncbi:hypothetical protein evm_012894 [Chilo suppressalis]|nr:hypothetical protein evm_012894 [Chilo suppressalis]